MIKTLIVDDNKQNLYVLQILLKGHGYEVISAKNGAEALEKARRDLPDVIITDILMPVMDGFTLCREWKSDERLKEIPLIFYTATYADPKDEEFALSLGAERFIVKPVEPDVFIEMLREVIDENETKGLVAPHELIEEGEVYYKKYNEALIRKLEDKMLQLEEANRELKREIAERKQAEEEIHRRNRELTLLNRVIAASATDLEPKTILETACRELALAFDIPRTVATLLNEDKTSTELVVEYLTEGRQSVVDDIPPLEDNPIIQDLLSHKTPLVVGDVRSDSRLASTSNRLQQRGAVSLVILPLVIKGDVVGSLDLEYPEPNHFSDEEVSLALNVADQVAGVLARVRLDEDRRRLSAGIEQTAESVVITDTEGRVLYVNPAFERITGYARDEVIGRHLNFLKSDKQSGEFYRQLWETISAGKVWHGRFVNKKKDGTLYADEATITPVRDETGAIVNYVSVQRDVTRELQLEEQYRQAQKMEAVGRLTAGIAHDFNNLLTAINGFAELMQYELKPDDPYQKYVDSILHSGQLAADLIRQLLVFSRKQIVEPQVLDLNVVVTEMGTLLRRIIGEDIHLKTKLTPDLWPIRADPTQIEQIIVNLAVNARDAMPEGGQLTIETDNVMLDTSYVAHYLEARPGDHVLLALNDTGIGMSEEVKAHIFEPFFTTKEEGKGTGLGLATIYGIVKQCGGNIWLYSEEGQGTTFKIYLPRVVEAVTPLPPRDQVGELPRGEETILLVEDDVGVRTLEVQVLRQQGYTVLEAADGEEALHLAQTHDEDIHLLLTDVVMPHMSGRELADRLETIRPGTKVLFTSGYTDNTIAHHGILAPGIAFLQKPFGPLALARKVREVLDN
jgi:PAS domain S-box-containing protein